MGLRKAAGSNDYDRVDTRFDATTAAMARSLRGQVQTPLPPMSSFTTDALSEEASFDEALFEGVWLVDAPFERVSLVEEPFVLEEQCTAIEVCTSC